MLVCDNYSQFLSKQNLLPGPEASTRQAHLPSYHHRIIIINKVMQTSFNPQNKASQSNMMQGISFEEKHSPDQDSDLETKLSHKQLNFSTSRVTTDDDGEDEEEEEFSFTCGGADASSPIAAEDAFINGQIKPIFPLFDRDFYDALPKKPPVKKIFVETKDSVESTSANGGEDGRKAVEVSPEVCKKSNSTGFSKIWRFKDLLGRSNSDGRDAFVFLNDAPPNKVKKGKTASLSAHEVYLRSKAKDGEKRRSYLPYRPELMGFFTNVNSGLTKNVHPY